MDDKWEAKRPAVARRKLAAAESTSNGTRAELLASRWPVLGEALVAHQRNLAATFAEEAYFCVEDGVIRQEERIRLAARAKELGLRVFDAELLIACALRDWTADNMHTRRPRMLVAEGRSPLRLWIGATVAMLVAEVLVAVWMCS